MYGYKSALIIMVTNGVWDNGVIEKGLSSDDAQSIMRGECRRSGAKRIETSGSECDRTSNDVGVVIKSVRL